MKEPANPETKIEQPVSKKAKLNDQDGVSILAAVGTTQEPLIIMPVAVTTESHVDTQPKQDHEM